jgi:cell wall-associated NlpC family hydrolase
MGYAGFSVASADYRVVAPSIGSGEAANLEASTDAPSTTPPNGDSTQTAQQATVMSAATVSAGYKYTTLTAPNRVEVSDAKGWVATFTNGSRTVSLRGQTRTFSEPSTTSAAVTHSVWVRLLSTPFQGNVDETRLNSLLYDTTPDVLAVAMQYIDGNNPLSDGNGLIIAGNADYGPLQADGTREEGADFNDYLGISKDYGYTVDKPESDQFNSLDCSGYIRMVFGYRLGLPLGLESDPSKSYIPRRAVQMYDAAPGTTLIAQGASAGGMLSSLIPGDLVFQDASTNDGTAIDHVGIYLGKDTQGNYRFVSSRKTANGPTLGDVGGKSTLNGTGLFARTFVAAKRL